MTITTIKFIYFEKAKIYPKISQKFLKLLCNAKKVWRLFHIFVTLSEYMNFIRNDRNYHDAKPFLLTGLSGNQKDSRKFRG